MVPAKKLAKRYRSFQSDIEGLINRLKANSDLGVPLGHNVFKIRLAVASKGKGKRGGAKTWSMRLRLSLIDRLDKSL